MSDLSNGHDRAVLAAPMTFAMMLCFEDQGHVNGSQERAMALTWECMLNQKALPRIFWAGTGSERESLQFFLTYFHPRQGRYLYLFFQDADVAGAFWLENVVAGHKADLGFWSRRKFWGQGSEIMLEQALQHSHELLPFIFMVTPHQAAANLATRLGLMVSAHVSDYYQVGQPIMIIRSTRDMWVSQTSPPSD